MTRRILLTGGSGFIGRNIREYLSSEYTILAPRHAELDLSSEADVRRWFRDNPVDAVIHSATKPGHRNAADPTAVATTNLRMFVNLTECARRSNVERFLFLGSGSEYDMRNYSPKMPETDLGRHIPEDETGFSKFVCTRMLEGMPGYVNVRFFGIFGRYEDYAIRFISNAICKALFDLPITLRQNRAFDYTDVYDGVRAIDAFLRVDGNLLSYNDYNVTPDRAVDLYDLACIVRTVAGKPDLPIVMASPERGREYSGDNSRFRALFPEFSFTPIEESVRRLYAWYASEKDAINRDLLLTDK